MRVLAATPETFRTDPIWGERSDWGQAARFSFRQDLKEIYSRLGFHSLHELDHELALDRPAVHVSRGLPLQELCKIHEVEPVSGIHGQLQYLRATREAQVG